MKTLKILIVRWGQVRIHDYYLAALLQHAGHEVAFAFYTPSFAYQQKHTIEILNRIKTEFAFTEFKETFFQKQWVRLNTVSEKWLGKSYPPLSLGFYLPQKLANQISDNNFDIVVPIEQHTLYWVAKAYPQKLHKVLYYSLEIQRPDDADVHLNLKSYLKEEQKWLHAGLLCLIIQDRFRAKALLRIDPEKINLKVLYLPLFVPGGISEQKSNFFSNKFKWSESRKVLLYFGEVYAERALPELVEAFCSMPQTKFVLVFHGSKNFGEYIKSSSNQIFFSEEFVPFDEINRVIDSARIGLAFYDNSKLNTRFTAFASEKITRYLQCGVPFIAFKNETYTALNNIAECAYLIDNFSQLEEAVNKIEDNYAFYSANAQAAFKKVFSASVKEKMDLFLQGLFIDEIV